MLDKVAHKLGIPVVYGRTTLDSREKAIQLLTDAGIDSSESFLSGDLRSPQRCWKQTVRRRVRSGMPW